MRLIRLVKIMIVFCVFLLGMAFPSDHNEEKFISICKALITMEDIHNSNLFCEYENQNTVFILSKTEFISNPNKRININSDSLNLSIWFKKDLFMENISYWYEFEDISEQGENIIVKLRSFNSVNTQEKKPIIQGEVILKPNKGGYIVEYKDISIR